jgi:broad specificity phosphatase PhoE
MGFWRPDHRLHRDRLVVALLGGATTLLIVRHADRSGTADALSPAGIVRAQELVHVTQKAGVTAIYRSNTVRSTQTAAPAATALGLTPVELAATDVQALVDHIFANHRGEIVLVVGHSNTIPQIIAAAGGPSVPDIAEDEFDNLFMLDICRCWTRAKLVNLQYGALSP